MYKNQHLITYPLFEPFEDILAFTTTKHFFLQDVPRYTGDSEEIYQSYRRRLAKYFKLDSHQLVFPRQKHTGYVASVYDFPRSELENTDALVTATPGICLCIQTADCVPVLLYDPQKKVVAAVHSGWRGTVNKIAEQTVSKMITEYKCSAPNIKAAIGPSIGPVVYEIGIEVAEAVRKNVPHASKLLHENSNGKSYLDLWEANRQILLKSKLLYDNIEIFGECSFTEKKKYYSARRDGINTGRMVSGIMLIKT